METCFVVESTKTNALLSSIKCKVCSGSATFDKRSVNAALPQSLLSLTRIAVMLLLHGVRRAWTATKRSALFYERSRCTCDGKHWESANITEQCFCYNEYLQWQGYLKTKLAHMAASAARKVTNVCARSARSLYNELKLMNPVNIVVCYNGLRMMAIRGSHSLHIGMTIEQFSEFGLDYSVLSNFCVRCAQPKTSWPGLPR